MASPFNIISNGAPGVPPPNAHPRPDWLRVKFFGGERYQDLKRIMRTLELHTVCESARCPNMGECWEHGTATFMIWETSAHAPAVSAPCLRGSPLAHQMKRSPSASPRRSPPWASAMPWLPA